MKLPKLYTERVGLITFYRGASLTGGAPHNLGAVGVVALEAAKKAYVLKLRNAATRARKERRKA